MKSIINSLLVFAKNYKQLLTSRTVAVVIALFSVLGYGALVIAAPIYNPGQTLSPTCAPSDPNCTVFPMSIGAGVALATPGSIPFIDANGSLQQDNANLVWDEVNKTLTLSKGLLIGNISVADSISGSYEVFATSSQVPNGAVVGNYIYSANNFNFEIFDISSPSNISLAGSVSLSGPGVSFADGPGTYFYAVDPMNSLLNVIDASNPASPSVSTVSVGNNPIRVFASGSYLYVVSREPKVEVFDNSNPASPVLVGSVTLSSDSNYAYLAGNYIYTMGNSGLIVVDVSNPASPAEVGTLASTSAASQFYVIGNYLYTFDLSGSTALDIVDVSNPASPVIVVDSLSVANCPSDMAFYGNYMYIGHCNAPQGITIVDITNPASASVVSNFDDNGAVYNVTVFGSYLFGTDSAGSGDNYKIWDLADPVNPEILATKSIPGDYYFGKAVISGSYAYFTGSNAGKLYAIDMTQLPNIYNPDDIVSLSVDGTIRSTILAGGGIVALYADNNGNIVPSYSDINLKKDIADLGLTDSMSKVRSLQGHTFNWKDTDRFGSQTEIGFIAQEVEQVVPEVVRQLGGYKTVNYQYLSALHNEAIKALDLRLAAIETVAGINEAEATRTLLMQFVDFLGSATKKVIGGALEIKGKLFANEIIIKDQSNGNPYCVTIVNGVLVAHPGESCTGVGTVPATTNAVMQTLPENTPLTGSESSSTTVMTSGAATTAATSTEVSGSSGTSTESATSTDGGSEGAQAVTSSVSSTAE